MDDKYIDDMINDIAKETKQDRIKIMLDYYKLYETTLDLYRLQSNFDNNPPIKEIHFFNDRFISPFEFKYPRGLKYYRSIFEEAPPDVKIGELSPLTYFDPNTAYRIHKHFPKTRIIAVLRNPVDLIFSYYLLLPDDKIYLEQSGHFSRAPLKGFLHSAQYFTVAKPR